MSIISSTAISFNKQMLISKNNFYQFLYWPDKFFNPLADYEMR